MVAEGSTAITKLFSGVFSDWWGKRKPLLLSGYGLAMLVRPVFPLANTVAVVFAARLIDRIGKGIRGAPRDALVADVTPPDRRGAAYGLRQSLDSVGGLPEVWTPAVLAVMNAVYFLTAYPVGHLADRFDRRRLLAAASGGVVLCVPPASSSARAQRRSST